MNERIKELAEQAKQYARERMSHPMNPSLYSADTFQRKFAELIVGECAELCRARKLTPSAFTADELLEHFGVKE